MATNFIQLLGQGLRGVGASTSDRNMALFQQQNQFDASRQDEKQKLLLGIAMKARENGAIGDQEFQKIVTGMGINGAADPGVGADRQEFDLKQNAAVDLNRRTQMAREEVASIYKNPEIPVHEKPLRAAEIYGRAGLEDQASVYTNIAKARADKTTKPHIEEFVVGTDPVSGKPLYQKHVVKGVKPNGDLDVVPVVSDKPHIKGALTEISINDGPERLSPTDAAKVELVARGIEDMKSYRGLLYGEDGSVNRSLILQMNVPMTKGVPFTDSRKAYSYLFNSVEAKLRAESGAAVPEQEVVRIMDRFYPSVFDDDSTIADKERRLDAFLRGTFERSKGGFFIRDDYGNIYEFNASGDPKKTNPPMEYTPPSKRGEASTGRVNSEVGVSPDAVLPESGGRVNSQSQSTQPQEAAQSVPKGAPFKYKGETITPMKNPQGVNGWVDGEGYWWPDKESFQSWKDATEEGPGR